MFGGFDCFVVPRLSAQPSGWQAGSLSLLGFLIMVCLFLSVLSVVCVSVPPPFHISSDSYTVNGCFLPAMSNNKRRYNTICLCGYRFSFHLHCPCLRVSPAHCLRHCPSCIVPLSLGVCSFLYLPLSLSQCHWPTAASTRLIHSSRQRQKTGN